MNDPARSDPPAPELVDVGGRRLAARLCGRGKPLVLLETGFGAESAAWQAVAEGIAPFTRVCSYDRAGLGASDPAPRPRGPDDLLADVHGLLHAIGGTPCIYVGQSFGGLMARLYAHRHPHDVAGIVLVDSMHVEQFDTIGPQLPPPFPGEPAQLTTMRAFWTGGWRDPSQNREGIDMVAFQAASRRVETLGHILLHVITASTFVHPPRFPAQAGQALQAAWERLQGDFTRLSSRATAELLAGSGHFVQSDRPQAVVDAVARMLAEVRS